MAKETKIRRVKAGDSKEKTLEKKPKISKYAAKVAGINLKKEEKPKKKLPKIVRIILFPFVILGKILAFIFKPFSPLFRYIKESWAELKLVRWPNRKESWKMTTAVLLFAIAFAIYILSLDGVFNWTFTTLMK